MVQAPKGGAHDAPALQCTVDHLLSPVGARASVSGGMGTGAAAGAAAAAARAAAGAHVHCIADEEAAACEQFEREAPASRAAARCLGIVVEEGVDDGGRGATLDGLVEGECTVVGATSGSGGRRLQQREQ